MTTKTQTARSVMTATDLFKLRAPGETAISPDGTQAAFSVRQVDGAQNRNRSSIWIASTGDAAARQVTDGERMDTSPRWSPDGTKLAFISNRGMTAQLYLLDLATGGEPVALTPAANHRVSAPVWSPDGRQIAYLGRVPSMPEPKQVVEYPDASDKPRVITRGKYKFNGEGFLDHTRKQVFVISIGGGEACQLTEGAMGVGSPVWSPDTDLGVDALSWSPDGGKIAFVSNREANEDKSRRHDIWTVDLSTGGLTRITANDGRYGTPVWSPDGTSIAFSGHRYPSKGGSSNRLWVAPAAGGEQRQVTDFDRAIGGSGMMSDTGQSERTQPAWIGDSIYFLAGMNGATQVFRVSAAGGEATQITSGWRAIAGWSITPDAHALAFDASTPLSPGEVFYQTLDDRESEATCLTTLNDEALSGMQLSNPEELWFDAPDGTGERVQGWIMKPPGFANGQKYPLLLEIHGGPARFYGAGWFHEFQFFAAQGYVLVYCNPRGSQGYGDTFATSIYQDWGTKPLMDVLAAVDHAVAQGSVDPEHLFVTGGSYGGYLTNWTVTHTDRFRAAATQRGVADMFTMALWGDNGTLWLEDYFGGLPWDEPDVYRRNSPITHIRNCTTPLFIEHEEHDYRCPMDQAEQMFNALKTLGVDTELVQYPNESHGMSRDGGPLHRIDRLLRITDWFERHA